MRCSGSPDASRPRSGRARSGRGGARAIATIAAGLLGALLAIACSSSDPARSAAERFVDAYYVEINLPRAREESVGLARAKVEDQIRLLGEQPVAEAGSRPSVHYKFLEQQVVDADRDRRGFLFELMISLGGESLTRRALVTVRNEGEAWHAANFQEMD